MTPQYHKATKNNYLTSPPTKNYVLLNTLLPLHPPLAQPLRLSTWLFTLKNERSLEDLHSGVAAGCDCTESSVAVLQNIPLYVQVE